MSAARKRRERSFCVKRDSVGDDPQNFVHSDNTYVYASVAQLMKRGPRTGSGAN